MQILIVKLNLIKYNKALQLVYYICFCIFSLLNFFPKRHVTINR